MGDRAVTYERSYILQEAFERMKLSTPKIKRSPNRDIDWTYMPPHGAKKLYDHFDTDTQFVFSGVVGEGAASLRPPHHLGRGVRPRPGASRLRSGAGGRSHCLETF